MSEKVVKVFENPSLSKYSPVKKGIDTGKNEKFVRFRHEVSVLKLSLESKNKKWFTYIKGGTLKKWYGNIDLVVNWKNEGFEISNYKGSTIRNKNFIKKEAITWSLTSSNGFGARYVMPNCVFDNNGSSVFPNQNSNFILGYLNSKVSTKILSVLNPTLDFQVGDIARLPIIWFNKFENERIIIECKSITINDWKSCETSWDFEESPLIKYQAENIETTYWNWEKAVTHDFMQLHQNEEELNRIFIDIYDLTDELTPNVPLKDITILQEEIDRKKLAANETQIIQSFRESGWQKNLLPINAKTVMEQFISYAIGCFMGRYRLGKKGLHIAHPNPTDEELQNYKLPETFAEAGKTFEIDGDGIVPLMEKEAAFADNAALRLRQFVQHLWGEDSLTQNLNFIESAPGKSIDAYLVKDFSKYHYRNYKKRPIYWLFRSSKGTFQVMTYLHRMNKYTNNLKSIHT